MAQAVAPLEGAVLDLGSEPPVINHSDLHREQFLFVWGRLSGWRDFGDAVAGPPGWDAAALAYFWGGPCLPDFLAGYGVSAQASATLEDQSRLLAVPLAFHRASRAQSEAQLSEAAQYLRGALSER
ncbi:phosphotransferase [Deinococcus sp.]|uniref:phosphotransferase n=1 Tax=Deinococcus sp. TaxID=47478 RepID=UPI003B5B8CFE